MLGNSYSKSIFFCKDKPWTISRVRSKPLAVSITGAEVLTHYTSHMSDKETLFIIEFIQGITFLIATGSYINFFRPTL